MSIKRNIVANYAGQLYATLIGVLLVPLYVETMGVEAYGLVGFFSMLQGWFMLLDMGLTPTIGRETARFNGGAIDALGLRRLLRAFEGIFVAVGAADLRLLDILTGDVMLAVAAVLGKTRLIDNVVFSVPTRSTSDLPEVPTRPGPIESA